MKALNRGGNDNEILRVFTSGVLQICLSHELMRIVLEL